MCPQGAPAGSRESEEETTQCAGRYIQKPTDVGVLRKNQKEKSRRRETLNHCAFPPRAVISLPRERILQLGREFFST